MFKPHYKSVRSKRASLCLAGVSVFAMTMADAAYAQSSDTIEDEVVAVGSRRVIQDAIALKRGNTQIVDGLSADEIGDIPALSIGEALENITGVASHRENGGATEVSVRGLGPYLSSTVVNGRVATNGSGDRSVNFSQFPSELMNKLEVFKTQSAAQIEGGVAGQINLETIKPLDFGKRRIQFEAKGNVNPDQLNQKDTEAGDIGYRFTGSYTDQFEVGTGDLGISIGFQRSDISQPEAEARQTGPTSNSRPACLITTGLSQYIEPTTGGTVTGFSNNPETRRRGDDDCDDVNLEGYDLDDNSGSANPTLEELASFRDGTVDPSESDQPVEGFDTELSPITGIARDFGVPFVFAPSQRHYRQNDTRDQRDALFGALQFQPNDRMDINLDLQWSERTQSELRNDLTFNGGRRNDTSLTLVNADGTTTATTALDSMVTTPLGGITRFVTDNTIEVQGGDYERKETYLGGGLNVEFDVTDRLTASADVSYSKTRRDERAFEFRIQSNASPVIEFDRRNNDVPVYTLHGEEFDVNNRENFVDRLRVRIDNDLERTNDVVSGRFDVSYDLGDGFFNEIEAGVRLAEQGYLSLGGGIDANDPYNFTTGRTTFEIEDNSDLEIQSQQVFDTPEDGLDDTYIGFIAQVNEACYTGSHPESNFLSSQRDEDLITNIYLDDDGNVVSNTTNTWATFDARCVAETGVGLINSILDDINLNLLNPDINDLSDNPTDPIPALSAAIPDLIEERTNTIDVTETTKAAYLMANYEGMIDSSLPISGNIGLRLVETDVRAVGYRDAFEITADDDGFLSFATVDGVQKVVEEHSYTRLLPSANMIMEVADDKLVRMGVFRAMSRPDPQDMGFSRTFTSALDDEELTTSVDAVIGSISGTGNPSFDPLMSWNYDASFEWYPNEDSIFAIGAYYKKFQGGFANVIQTEEFNINGELISRDVAVQQTSEEKSNLFGVEITASHGFTYLPGLLSGLGAKISYNYVTSDFEFEDSRYGDRFITDVNGNVTQIAEGIIAPGGLPGLSENTISAQVYYGIGDLDFAVNYKYRDDYFQPFTSDGSRLRFVGDVGVWEARAAWKVTDNFRLTAEAINLFSAPKEQFAFVADDLYEVNDYGPRIFFGLRGRF